MKLKPARGDQQPLAAAMQGLRDRLLPLLQIAAITLLFACYEAAKESFLPALTKWQSHYLSICMTAIISTIVVYYTHARFAAYRLYLAERKRIVTQLMPNEHRLESLLRLAQSHANSVEELLDCALEEAVAFTGSKIGYIFHYDEQTQVITLNSWSREAMKQCAMAERPAVYQLDKTGLWGEPIRQRKAIIVNNYRAPNPFKKGYPQGHVHVTSLLSIPVFIQGRIVAVVGVGNKAADYEQADVRQLTLLMDSVWNIVERKRVEASLRASEQRHRLFAENVTDIIWTIDLRGLVTYVSPSARQLWGYTPEELLELPFAELWAPSSTELVCKRLADTIAMAKANNRIEPGQLELELRCKDGSTRWGDVSYSGMYNESGELIALQGVTRDATERRRMEDELRTAKDAAEAANRAKSQFLATMSHEIRTPLTAVLGYADLMLDQSLDLRSRHDYLAAIGRNGQHLLTLINDILDLSKIEAGKLALNLGRCNLAAVLSDVVSMARPQAKQHGNSLSVQYDGAIPECIHADAVRLRQALTNLVGNAVKFTENGAVSLQVSFLPEWRNDRAAVRIDVIDTGVGIPEDMLPQLFQPFTQADATMARKYGGSGLGLAIARRLVEMAGGELTVHSAPGRGSTFTVTVPAGTLPGIKMLDAPAEALTESPANVPTGHVLQGVRVLLAEDGVDNQALIETVLRKAGASVAIAENGRVAVDKALAEAFDLILMDINMPVMDGYQATRLLRSEGYERPIVALTANAMVEDVARSLEAGCNDHLTKPIDRQGLIRAVAKHVGKDIAVVAAGPAQTVQMESVAESPVESLFADDPDIEPILNEFVANLAGYAGEMRLSLANGDYESLQRQAHKLKGSGGGYGYPTLTEASKRLEDAGKARDGDAAAAALEQVTRLCAAIAAGHKTPISTGSDPS
jgi:PAS domain S-box-containing protein